jgi:hypothetical protein
MIFTSGVRRVEHAVLALALKRAELAVAIEEIHDRRSSRFGNKGMIAGLL